MIDLLPTPRDGFLCPCDGARLTVYGFVLPGMLPFARTRCPACDRRFLSRLHTDFVSIGECHHDEATGEAYIRFPGWYKARLEECFRTRGNPAPPLETVRRRPLGAAVAVLNALDPVYGHALHKLFSFGAVKSMAGMTTLAIVPRFLAWLVPDAIDEIWIVDSPRETLSYWNQAVADALDGLAVKCRRLLYVGVAWQHEVAIEDFSKIRPNVLTPTSEITPGRIVVNWREDRCWTQRGRKLPSDEAVADQLRLYGCVLEAMRERSPGLRATVAGYGLYGRFADWIEDLRIDSHDSDAERTWTRRAAQAHLVIGVHGSNMILPAAHAASAMEIVPAEKWPTVMVTWEWVNAMPAQVALRRYRLIPDSASVSDIASIAHALLRARQFHAAGAQIRAAESLQARKSLEVANRDFLQIPDPIVCRDGDGNEI